MVSIPFVHKKGDVVSLAIDCFDEDTLKAHDLIGMGRVDVTPFMVGTAVRGHLRDGVEVPVQLSTVKKANCGVIVLNVRVALTA
jgi:hypothetical protein